jgi:hypothetical protein
MEDLDSEWTNEELMLRGQWRRLRYNPRHHANEMMWAPLHCLALDEHLMWATNAGETQFALCVKH